MFKPDPKKIIQLGLVAFLLPVLVIGASRVSTNIVGKAAGEVNTLSLLSEVNGVVGTNFTVPVILSPSGGNIEGIDVRITFNPSTVRMSKIDRMVDPSTGLVTFLPLNSSNSFDSNAVVAKANQTGVVEFSAVTFDAANQQLKGSYKSSTAVVLANLTFTPLSPGTYPIAFDFKPASPKLTTDSNVVMAGKPPTDGLTGVTNLNLIVGAAVTPPTPPSNSVDILTNPGFESGSLDGWTNQNITISNVASDRHGGSYSARLSGNTSHLSQNVASKLKPDVDYTFSVWVKVNTLGTSWGAPGLRISRYQDLGTSEFGEVAAENSTTRGWQEIKITRKFTSSELSGNINVGIRNFGFTGVDVVDDFKVVESGTTLSTPTPTSGSVSTPTSAPNPTSSPTATLAPTAQTFTLTAETANQDGSTVVTPGTWIGTGGSTGSSYLGLRFANLNLPKGAKVTTAKVEVESSQQQWISVNFDLFGENSDDSQPFSGSALISTRSLTSVKASHTSNTQWNAGTWYALPDLSAVVTSVVARSNWKAGNDLSIIITGAGSAYGRKQINGARITITYQ